MALYNLGDELQKIIDLYRDHRKGYDEVLAEMAAVNEKYDGRIKKYNLNQNQKTAVESERAEELKKLNGDIKALRENFKTQSEEIITDIDRVFGKRYKVHADMVDDNVLKLLNADLYTNDELIELFDQYNEAGNLAMMRAVAKNGKVRSEKEIDSKKSLKLRSMEYDTKKFTPEYAALTGNTLEVCNRSLGIRRDNDYYAHIPADQAHRMAKGWAESHFEDMTSGFLERASEIYERV